MTEEEKAKPITDSCQACYLYCDHERCTGSTTLGTRACACKESGHKKYTKEADHAP